MYSREGGSRYLKGDIDPTDFNWTDLLTKPEYMTLLLRNGKIRKACSWVSREAIRPRFTMKKEMRMPGMKFGKLYTFDSIVEYLEWIGFFTQLECAYTWARCLGTSIIVMFKEGEGKKDFYEPRSDYDSIQAYYPTCSGNGYDIVKQGDDYYYKISFTNILGSTEVYKVSKDRVVTFNAPHLELKYEGNSEIEALAKIAIVQEQMFRSVMKRLHEMGAGTAVIAVASEEEKAAIDSSVSDSLKYTSKIYTTGDPKQVMEMYVPNLAMGQFREIWEIAQEEIANNMNMSKKIISGDPQGAISSAKWDIEISYTEVYQTQRHYHKATEHVLFLLGIPDTTFMWNDPFPTEQTEEVDTNGRSTQSPSSAPRDAPSDAQSTAK